MLILRKPFPNHPEPSEKILKGWESLETKAPFTKREWFPSEANGVRGASKHWVEIEQWIVVFLEGTRLIIQLPPLTPQWCKNIPKCCRKGHSFALLYKMASRVICLKPRAWVKGQGLVSELESVMQCVTPYVSEILSHSTDFHWAPTLCQMLLWRWGIKMIGQSYTVSPVTLLEVHPKEIIQKNVARCLL
jgi:hypothetical protein